MRASVGRNAQDKLVPTCCLNFLVMVSMWCCNKSFFDSFFFDSLLIAQLQEPFTSITFFAGEPLPANGAEWSMLIAETPGDARFLNRD